MINDGQDILTDSWQDIQKGGWAEPITITEALKSIFRRIDKLERHVEKLERHVEWLEQTYYDDLCINVDRQNDIIRTIDKMCWDRM